MTDKLTEAARAFFGVKDDYTGDINFDLYARFAAKMIAEREREIAAKCEFLSCRNGGQIDFDKGWNGAMKHMMKILESSRATECKGCGVSWPDSHSASCDFGASDAHKVLDGSKIEPYGDAIERLQKIVQCVPTERLPSYDRQAIQTILAENQRLRDEVAELKSKLHSETLVAQFQAHRAVGNQEQDITNGKLAGYCLVCQIPWPCEYAALKQPVSDICECGHPESHHRTESTGDCILCDEGCEQFKPTQVKETAERDQLKEKVEALGRDNSKLRSFVNQSRQECMDIDCMHTYPHGPH